jgi:hypothetical protein
VFESGSRRAQGQKNRSTSSVERFLSSIRFESKGKLAELGGEIDKNPYWFSGENRMDELNESTEN